MQQWADDEVGGYMPPPPDGAGDGSAQEEYYYYYEMPDGSVGYIAASDYAQQQQQQQQLQGQGQLYSPEDQGLADGSFQPTGYTEPTYGQGTPYAPPLQEATAPPPAPAASNVVPQQINNNYYYYYDPNAAVPAPQQPPSAQLPPPSAAATAAVSPESMEAAPLPQLPHEAGAGAAYAAPQSYKELRRLDGTQKWHTALLRSCWKEPCYCLGACVAPWCVVAAHRRRLLRKDDTQYRCCGGVCGRVDGCECCGGAPQCSLFWEVLLCLPCACFGNRYMLMQRYGLKASCCDRTVTGCGCFCAPLHCCGECTRCFPEAFWSWLYLFIYPCMLTQHHRELDAHAKGDVAVDSRAIAAAPEG